MELLEGEAEFTKEKVEDEMELRECNGAKLDMVLVEQSFLPKCLFF